MPSSSISLWVWTVFIHGLAQSISGQNLDPIDTETLEATGPQDLLGSLGSDAFLYDSSSFFTDINLSGSEDYSLATNPNPLDLDDPSLSASFLDASCFNGNNQPSRRLKARGEACAGDKPANGASHPTTPSMGFAGESAGTLDADGYWCYDPSVPLYHTVAICDVYQVPLGTPGTYADLDPSFWPTGYHSAVYPASLSKLHIIPCSLLAYFSP